MHGVAFADEEKSQGVQQDEEFDDLSFGRCWLSVCRSSL